MSNITLDEAQAVLGAALEKSREMDAIMSIAVVDAGGHLKAFASMDGGMLGVIDIAIRKAYTARLFNMNTGEIGKLSQPGEPAYGVEHSNGGLITFPGGVPLKRGDRIVGAVGVSGSTVENDHIVAEAGLAAMG
jgi:uncharacterized protein GlcG (DUF336 family)